MKKLNTLFMLFVCYMAWSQSWDQSLGVNNKAVRSILPYSTDTILVAAGPWTSGEGIYLSSDQGASFSQFTLNGEVILDLYQVGEVILAGTKDNDLFRADSIDGNWSNIYLNDYSIEDFVFCHDTLFAATYSTSPTPLHYSLDTGLTWSQYGSGTPGAFISIDCNNNRLFTGNPSGGFYADNNTGWSQTSGISALINKVTSIGNDSVLYSSNSSIFLSTNNGNTASSIYFQVTSLNPSQVYYIEDTLFSTHGNLKYSIDFCQSWTDMNLSGQFYDLVKHANKLFVAKNDGLFYLNSSSSAYIDEPNNEIIIYPNPAIDRININGWHEEETDTCIKLYDSQGRLVLSSKESTIDVSSLERGQYLCELSSNSIYKTSIIILN
jgi:hypothetical protein